MDSINAEGTQLYAEEVGHGGPVIFVHEFADNIKSWSPQISALSRRFRCIAFNARGYPPSGVPEDPQLYSQEIAARDINSVLKGYALDSAHIVGCSMGAFAALHHAILFPGATKSITLISCGYGAAKDQQAAYSEEAQVLAEKYSELGSVKMAEHYADGAFRQQFKVKDPLGWREFKTRLSQHSEVGAALTMRGVQAKRPSLYDLEEDIKRVELPALIIFGDEDDWCIEPSIYLKRTLPMAGLCALPKTGHTVNLEEPELINRVIADFLATVENRSWSKKTDYLGKSALLSGLE